MGDAWIQKFKNRPNSFGFKFTQANHQYAKWKAEMIGVHYSMNEYLRKDKRTNKISSQLLVNLTINKEVKREMYNLFYNPNKEVSMSILSEIDDVGLSVWYMDDGNMYYNGKTCHLTIATNSFSLSSIELIISWFRDKYDINFKMNKNKSIRLTSRKECEKFMIVVDKYIPECMEYKKLSYQIDKHLSTLTESQLKCINKKYKI